MSPHHTLCTPLLLEFWLSMFLHGFTSEVQHYEIWNDKSALWTSPTISNNRKYPNTNFWGKNTLSYYDAFFLFEVFLGLWRSSKFLYVLFFRTIWKHELFENFVKCAFIVITYLPPLVGSPFSLRYTNSFVSPPLLFSPIKSN